MNRAFRTLTCTLLSSLALTACDGRLSGNAAAQDTLAQRDTSAQLAFGASIVVTHQGLARARVVADSAYIHDDGLRFDLRRVGVTFVDTAGDSVSFASAPRGTYDVRNSRLVLLQQVIVQGANGRQLQSSTVSYDPERDLLTSDSSYTWTQAAGASPTTGDSLQTDPKLAALGRTRRR